MKKFNKTLDAAAHLIILAMCIIMGCTFFIHDPMYIIMHPNFDNILFGIAGTLICYVLYIGVRLHQEVDKLFDEKEE